MIGYRIPLAIAAFIILMGCSPVTDPDTGRLDSNIVGTWIRDDDSSGDESNGDEAMVFFANGNISYGDYLDPDGAGPELDQWIFYSFGYTWLNGYYHDYRGNDPPNNYVSGSIEADDGSGDLIHLFQYRYTAYPDEITVLSVNSFQGVWQRQ